jgi:tryptophan-rich hypothetical protein
MYNQKKIPPSGSKWTALEETLGWRHFQLKQNRRQGSMTFVLMQASCDASQQLWVSNFHAAA